MDAGLWLVSCGRKELKAEGGVRPQKGKTVRCQDEMDENVGRQGEGNGGIFIEHDDGIIHPVTRSGRPREA